MKSIISHMASALLLLLFCSPSNAQTTFSGNITVDGLNRSYRLRIPPAAGSGDLLPLVINMHGFSGSASQQESYSGMNAVADTANFFVVYPNGTNIFLFLKGWYMELSGAPVDDVAFLSALIDDLVANYNIDAGRVFSTGFSMGGGMTVSLGCALSDKVSAIAPVAAYVPAENGALCNPANSIPMLQIHGTGDGVVPYNGSSSLAPALSVIRAFAADGGCIGVPSAVNLPDIDPSDGSTVSLAFKNDCGPLANDYRFYRVNGGGHDWPGAAGANQDFNASAEMWNFFRTVVPAPKRAQPLLAAAESDLDIFPNPASAGEKLYLNLTSDLPYQILMIDYFGREITRFEGQGSAGQRISVQLPELSSGMYHVLITDQEIQKSSVVTIF